MTTHLVTAGGGGFSMSSNGAPTALDRYWLDLTGKSSPLVCFAPTASADDPSYINRFLTAYGTLGVRTMILTLWQGAGRSVERLSEADLVVVGGGSTVNLVALWNAHGVSHVLRSRADAGGDLVLGGISAGASCWFQGCVTDSFGDFRAWHGGLGLVEGSFCPHFDGEGDRAPVFTQAVATGALGAGYACDDGAALHFVNGTLERAITERERAGVQRILPSAEPTASGVLLERVEAELI